MININTQSSFRRQLDIAQTSNSLVVILFYQYHLKEDCQKKLPDHVINEYLLNHGDRIQFLKTNMRDIRIMFQIQSYPTVVAIKGDGKEIGRISIAQTIDDRIFLTGLRMLLDDCLKVENDDKDDDMHA